MPLLCENVIIVVYGKSKSVVQPIGRLGHRFQQRGSNLDRPEDHVSSHPSKTDSSVYDSYVKLSLLHHLPQLLCLGSVQYLTRRLGIVHVTPVFVQEDQREDPFLHSDIDLAAMACAKMENYQF